MSLGSDKAKELFRLYAKECGKHDEDCKECAELVQENAEKWQR